MAILGDAVSFIFPADDIAVDVLEKHQRDAPSVTELDKLGGFEGAVRKKNAVVAQKMAAMLLDEGIYVIAFAYPVVPQGQARIRLQISAGHTKDDLDKAISSFQKVGKELGLC